VKILVIYKPDNSCIFLYPEIKNKAHDETEEQWLQNERNRLLQFMTDEEPNIATFEYDFYNSEELPDKKYKTYIRGTKNEPLSVDMDAYNNDIISELKNEKISEIKVKATEIINSNYPLYKKENIRALIRGHVQQEIDNLNAYIEYIAGQCDVFEAEILAKTSIEEIEQYQYSYITE